LPAGPARDPAFVREIAPPGSALAGDRAVWEKFAAPVSARLATPPVTASAPPPRAPPRPARALPAVAASLCAAAAWLAPAAEPVDAARTAPQPLTRFLAEVFPEGLDPERSREPHSIREPGPDTANYPNSPDTLPRGAVYVETSPVFFSGPISTLQPQTYNAEFLYRMGLTDRVEFRLFSNGYTWQAAGLGMPQTTGFSPLVFDTKIHFWEENRDYWLPAVGFEAYVQTPWGSPAFNAGTQPSLTMLFRSTLFWGLEAEYNVGVAADSTRNGFVPIDVIQWAITKSITDDFDLFVHGFQNQSALPRVAFQTVVGGGFVCFPNDRVSFYGNWGAGTDKSGPASTFQLGVAGSY